MRILIVEDETKTGNYLQQGLTEAGFVTDLARDGTFFAKMVLVGMDVSAGFILLEKYSERRDTQTWDKAVESGKRDLKINIVQVVGDQAKALCSLAKDRLGVAKVEYVDRIGQANDTVKFKALQVIQKQLRAKLLDPQGLWRTLPTDLRRTLQAAAQDCVDLFQRSTGCVEGRNGVLSLHQHQMRGLNPKLLASLTVIHNFVIVRSDGSTAAMRFFGREPDQPLFEHLCQVLPPPARPRKRARQPNEDILGVDSA